MSVFGNKSKPGIPVPVPTQIFNLRVELFDGDIAADNKITAAKVSLQTAANPTGPTLLSDGAGNCEFRLTRGDYDVWVEPAGFKRREQHVQLRANAVVQLSLQRLTPVVVQLPPLRVAEAYLSPAGQLWTAIEASDFALLARYQREGLKAVEPVIAQRAAAGINLLRVWTRYQGWSIGGDSYTDIDYSKVPELLQLCARYGMYVELVGFAGTRLNYLDTGTTWPADPMHWAQLLPATAGQSNVLLELVNEADQAANLMDTAAYMPPPGLLASHGSNGSQAWPVQPYWSYLTFHTNGADEEQRKIGHNAAEIAAAPVLTNETSRYPEVGMWAGQELGRCLQLAFDSAAAAALLCTGSCFHSVAGKLSKLWDGNTAAVAAAWVAGARSIDLTQRTLPYVHEAGMETPELLRVYRKGSCIVRIRK